MKVVFILPDLGAGGAERVVTIISHALVKRKIPVDILLFLSDRIQYKVPEGVNIVKLNTLGISQLQRIKCLRAYFKQQREKFNRMTVIPFHDSCLKYAEAASAGLGIRVIATERNDPYQKGRSGISRLKSMLPYAFAKQCVFQTPDALAYYWLCPKKKRMVIENPLVLPEGIEWNGQASRRIISVGRLDPQKNQRILIEAFSRIHRRFTDYTLEIYGEGALRGQLQEQIDGLGLKDCVFLRGYAEDIHQRLQDAALFVLSSDYEGMSNALIEALAIGVPSISTDHPIGGARMLMEDGVNGLLTPVGDVDALERAMEKLLSERELACSLGEKGRAVRKRLDVETITDRWLEVIGT